MGGQDIVTEAMRTVIIYGFTEMKLHRISAEIEDDNPESIALIKKLGFSYEGTLKEFDIRNGRVINLQLYAILSGILLG